MSDDEMRDAFNANMMSTGFLCDGPADFGRRYGKRWLVSAYEAGDVVLHAPHTVCRGRAGLGFSPPGLNMAHKNIPDPRVHHQRRPRSKDQAGDRPAICKLGTALGHGKLASREGLDPADDDDDSDGRSTTRLTTGCSQEFTTTPSI